MAKNPTDTGPRKIEIAGGDGDQYARGLVEQVTGMEQRPCMACRSFEKNDQKLLQLFLSHGFKLRPDGKLDSPTALKDGRVNMEPRNILDVLDPRSFGYCRKETRPVDQLATCDKWAPTKTASELAGRIQSR
jgi:hypothetical protein